MSMNNDANSMRQKMLLELNEKLLEQKKELDAQVEDLQVEKSHIATEKKKIEDKNKLLWEQSTAIHKEKERIDLMRQEVEMRHKEVMDSISYAKKIQEAILPEATEIKNSFPEHFVFFRPKDVVSGDFYWYREIPDFAYIAAVDCTGHGVPGAFMSMIGHIQLDEILLKSGITAVNEILHVLDERIRKILKQDGSESSSRDGMDICLCAYDKKNKVLHYTGANRPLWIIRKDAEEIEEYKPNKVAIGGLLLKEFEFTRHELKIEKGDSIYLFSDGYPDQFSWKEKKFMTKRFRDLIVSFREKNMDEQLVIIENNHLDWKGNSEQTDDVLVIGIRF